MQALSNDRMQLWHRPSVHPRRTRGIAFVFLSSPTRFPSGRLPQQRRSQSNISPRSLCGNTNASAAVL